MAHDPGWPDDGWGEEAVDDDEYGHGLLWVLLWTVLGTLLPGTGLLRAGRLTLGLLAAMLAVAGTAFGLYSRRDLVALLGSGSTRSGCSPPPWWWARWAPSSSSC